MLVSRAQGTEARLQQDDLPGHRLGLVGGHFYPVLQAQLANPLVVRQDAADEGAIFNAWCAAGWTPQW
ncbi:hypothetical protein [Pseudomonas sp. SJZ079]|uniref:hypothetical protein n=1 Tax=Pseudomonas sp. SJZ079 TaxID=2572887 RepID=UPI0011BFC88E|nr:hypothetical protein [Pseudomonas sp. SJZ079]